MGLIQCKECGHRCSSKAVACPRCGGPIKRKGISTATGCLILAILVPLALSSLCSPNLVNDRKVRDGEADKPESVEQKSDSNQTVPDTKLSEEEEIIDFPALINKSGKEIEKILGKPSESRKWEKRERIDGWVRDFDIGVGLVITTETELGKVKIMSLIMEEPTYNYPSTLARVGIKGIPKPDRVLGPTTRIWNNVEIAGKICELNVTTTTTGGDSVKIVVKKN